MNGEPKAPKANAVPYTAFIWSAILLVTISLTVVVVGVFHVVMNHNRAIELEAYIQRMDSQNQGQ